MHTQFHRRARRAGFARAIVVAMKGNLSIVLALVVGAAMGCGGSHKQAAAPAESPCVGMAAHVVSFAPAEMAQMKDAMQQVMSEQCQADHWSPEVIDCMAKADATTMKACGDKLTPEQQESMAKAMQAKMGGGAESPKEEEKSMDPGAMDPCAGGE